MFIAMLVDLLVYWSVSYIICTGTYDISPTIMFMGHQEKKHDVS